MKKVKTEEKVFIKVDFAFKLRNHEDKKEA